LILTFFSDAAFSFFRISLRISLRMRNMLCYQVPVSNIELFPS
jgi:hypothetical protein